MAKSSDGINREAEEGISLADSPAAWSSGTMDAMRARMADPTNNFSPTDRAVLEKQILDEKTRQEEEERQRIEAANQVRPAPAPAPLPAPAAPFVAPPGATNAMFNSPENLKRIADLLSKADSGLPIEAVMEEIRVATGLSDGAFWKALSEMNKTAGENPFVDGGKADDKDSDEDESDDKDDKKDGKAPPFGKKDEKKDDKPAKGKNPFEKKDDSDKDEPEEKDEKPEPEEDKEPKEKSEPKAEPKEKAEKEEPEEEKKSKSEIKREKKKEKDEAKLLKQMLGLGEKLLKLEKGEDEAHIAELKNAIEILKEFSKEEKEEDGGEPFADDMAMIEKTGPDLPPALEGLAVPMPKPMDDGMDVIDLAPPALELAAAKTSPEAQKFIHEKMRKMHKEPGAKNPKQDIAIALNMAREKGMKVPDAPAKKKAELEVKADWDSDMAAGSGGERREVGSERYKYNDGGDWYLREFFNVIPREMLDLLKAGDTVTVNKEDGQIFVAARNAIGKNPHVKIAEADNSYDQAEYPDTYYTISVDGEFWGSADDITSEPSKAKASFKLHDRVWRKADFESGFETAGDEAGRIVDFGSGKAIVDWGHEDGIPTEEKPEDLVLASTAGIESHMFSLPKESEIEELEPVNPIHGAMGGQDEVEHVLRETSLHDILARSAEEGVVAEGTITLLASGKKGSIINRLAGGQLRVAVDGKELTVWPYEVE